LAKRQINIRIHESILETSENLRSEGLTFKGLEFFNLHTGSKNNWHCFVFQMGLIKIKEEFEKFKKSLETED